MDRPVKWQIILPSAIFVVLLFILGAPRPYEVKTHNYLKAVSNIEDIQIKNVSIGKLEMGNETLTIVENIDSKKTDFEKILSLKENLKAIKALKRPITKPESFYTVTISTTMEKPMDQVELYVDTRDYSLWIPEINARYDLIYKDRMPVIKTKCITNEQTRGVIKEIIDEAFNKSKDSV